MVLRVLTLDIWNVSGGWRDRRGAILDVLPREAPDVVCPSRRVPVVADRPVDGIWPSDHHGVLAVLATPER